MYNLCFLRNTQNKIYGAATRCCDDLILGVWFWFGCGGAVSWSWVWFWFWFWFGGGGWWFDLRCCIWWCRWWWWLCLDLTLGCIWWCWWWWWMWCGGGYICGEKRKERTYRKNNYYLNEVKNKVLSLMFMHKKTCIAKQNKMQK